MEVVETDADRGLIFVKGSVPGAKGGWLLVKDAVKKRQPDDLPFPAAIRGANGGAQGCGYAAAAAESAEA